MRPIARFAFASACLLLTQDAIAVPSYVITDLGFNAQDVNSSGIVVGNLGSQAVYYDGTLHDMTDILEGPFSEATGINDSGHITGWVQQSTANRGFFYDGSTVQHIANFNGWSGSTYAQAVNESGTVAGWVVYVDNIDKSFTWDGTSHDLGTMGGKRSYAQDINDGGTVAGYYTTNGNLTHAFRSGSDLGTLGGTTSYGYAVNNDGTVVGMSTLSNGQWRAYSYNGTMQNLGVLSGTFSSANDINNNGEIVGQAGPAFLYRPGEGMVDLNTKIHNSLGWNLFTANGISDAGHIIGRGTQGGFTTSFLLTPIDVMLGDMDGDDDVDNFDIQAFEMALTDVAGYVSTYGVADYALRGDANGNGTFDNFDIQPFEELLTSSAPISVSAAVPEPSTAVLLALGAVAFIGFGMRSRR